MNNTRINSLNRFIAFSVIGLYILRILIDIITLIITSDLSTIKLKEYLVMLINSTFLALYLRNAKWYCLLPFSIILFVLNFLIFVHYLIWVIINPFPFYMFLHNLGLLTLMAIGPVTIGIETFMKVRRRRKK